MRSRVQSPAWSRVELWGTFFPQSTVRGQRRYAVCPVSRHSIGGLKITHALVDKSMVIPVLLNVTSCLTKGERPKHKGSRCPIPVLPLTTIFSKYHNQTKLKRVPPDSLEVVLYRVYHTHSFQHGWHQSTNGIHISMFQNNFEKDAAKLN